MDISFFTGFLLANKPHLAVMFIVSSLQVMYLSSYRIAQFIDGENIDGLALFRHLTRKILTDDILDDLYSGYTAGKLKGKILTDR